MSISILTSRRASRIAILVLSMLVLSSAAMATIHPPACTNCPGLTVLNTNVEAQAVATDNIFSLPASGGPGFASLQITASSAPGLPAGTYAAWCGTAPGDALPMPGTYVANSTANLPSPLWNEINWVLNHKQGNIIDVQGAIWALLGRIPPANLTGPAATMYADAMTPAGQSFVPGPGQTIGVLMSTGAVGRQTMIVEFTQFCGALGDFVWVDTNYDGLQNDGPTGINNVTVQLFDAANTLVATTTTGFSPAGYAYMPAGTAGYYQFNFLCQGAYTVKVDSNQPALTGYVPTHSVAGSDRTIDSNGSPASSVLTPVNLVDETLDFGFVTQLPALTAQCLKNGTVNQFYSAQIVADGGLSPYTYAISGSLPPGLIFDALSGVLSGTPGQAGSYSITITVTDSSGLSSGTKIINCTIKIVDQLKALCAPGSVILGQPFSSQIVATGGSGNYTFMVTGGSLPSGLTLDAHTGVISGSTTDAGPHSFSVTVTDGTGEGAQTVVLNCSLPVYSQISATCAGGIGFVGQPFSPAITVTGGSGNYSFTLTAGTLPDGVHLNANGAIAGIPTALNLGTNSFTVKVVDLDTGGIVYVNASCTIQVYQPLAATCASGTAMVGVAYSSAIVATGGSGSYSFAPIGSLPAGLTLNADGTISGTPLPSAITSSFQVKVTDTVLGNAVTVTTSNCTITVYQQLAATCANGTGIVGTPYSSAITVTGGSGSYSFALIGSLPAGLSLNPTTGTITGTPLPSAITSSFQVKVTDTVLGNAVTVTTSSCTITIYQQLTATCASGTGIVGAAYSSAVTVTGGSGSYSYTLVGGLPPGLWLNAATGVITGIPAANAVISTFQVKVTDTVLGNSITVMTGGCTIAIPTLITLTCPLTTGQVGVAYNSAATVNGGVAPYTFSVISGSLPDGLTLNPATGAITGTPANAGSFSFSIKVVDHNGAFAISTCTQSCGAGRVTWNFSSPGGNRGSTEPYTVNGITIRAYGYSNSNAARSLHGNSDSGDDYGLGIDGTSQDEIDASNYVQLDLGAAIAAGAQNAQTIVTSVQNGARFNVYGSNTQGTIGTLLLSDQTTDGTPFSIPSFATYRYISVRASAGNVLLGAVSFTFGNCNITIAPPITLECGSCGAGKATVGVQHSAGLRVTGGTGPYTYSLANLPNNLLPPGMTLNPATGMISGVPTTPGTYTFTSLVKDSENNTDTVTCTIIVQAPPVNLECGTCGGGKATTGTSYSATLSASGGIGPYTYAIVSNNLLPPGLTLNASTGVISGIPTQAGTYSFTTKVTDSKGTTDTTTCTIVVQSSVVNLDCGTCGAAKATVNAYYAVNYSLSGGASPYAYTLVTGTLPPGLSLNGSTGKISGTPTTVGSYQFTVKATDSNGNSDTATCTIVVQGPAVNLECGACGSNSVKIGSAYSAALSASGGKAAFTYSITSGSLPQGLTLNTSTGTISGTPTSAGSYTVTFKVVDANGSSDTATCTIVVTGSAVNLDCGTCGASKATVGVSYSATYSVSGGTGPYTYSKISGSLPPGMSLGNSTGKITGTPTAAGTYSFTVKVVDSKGNSDTADCTIVVSASTLDLQCGTCGNSSAATGTFYSAALAVSGGTGPFTFSAIGSLPPGVLLNASTGAISGTPTTAGKYTFTTKVVDSKGNSDTATCTITVANAAVNLECGTCGNSRATIGKSYSVTLAATGGSGSYTYSMSSGSLPAGLALNSGTGAISGTPTQPGSYTFTTKVVDSKGHLDTVTCTIYVAAAAVDLTCGTCSAGKATAGKSYTATMGVSGGKGPYTFSLVSGSLPQGLTLSASTGVISGTPSAVGSATFTIKVVDANGATDTATCTITTIAPPIELGCGTCGSGRAYTGTAYSATLPVTGGKAAYTFSVTAGSLPLGLSLNAATGAISGTPASGSVGTRNVTFKVVDAYGSSDTVTCTFTVSQH